MDEKQAPWVPQWVHHCAKMIIDGAPLCEAYFYLASWPSLPKEETRTRFERGPGETEFKLVGNPLSLRRSDGSFVVSYCRQRHHSNFRLYFEMRRGWLGLGVPFALCYLLYPAKSASTWTQHLVKKKCPSFHPFLLNSSMLSLTKILAITLNQLVRKSCSTRSCAWISKPHLVVENIFSFKYATAQYTRELRRHCTVECSHRQFSNIEAKHHY